MKIVYLKPQSSFKNNLRSDTIWGTICWSIKELYSNDVLEEFIKSYSDKNIVKISSAFPYKELEDEKVLYFPKPKLKPLDINSYFEKNNIEKKAERKKIFSKIKKYKKTKFVNKNTFEAIIKGQYSEEDLFEEDITFEDTGRFKNMHIVHNTIDRLKGTTLEGNLFTSDEVFTENSGMFFLIDGEGKYINLVESALRYLNHMGIGGDRSTGKGAFDISIENFDLDLPTDPDGFVTLSLYSPTNNELENINKKYSWYEIETRKGKFGGQYIKAKNFWKKSVLAFSEGSIIGLNSNDNYGSLINVKDPSGENNFSIKHFGISFNIPIKIKE